MRRFAYAQGAAAGSQGAASWNVVVETQVAQNGLATGPIRIVNGNWEIAASVLLFARDEDIFNDYQTRESANSLTPLPLLHLPGKQTG